MSLFLDDYEDSAVEGNSTVISKSVDEKKNYNKKQMSVLLTERSFHVIGRTCLGIPDQLSFRSSSVNNRKNTRGSILDLQQTPETERFLLGQQRLTVSIAVSAKMMPHKILIHTCKGKRLVCFHPPPPN